MLYVDLLHSDNIVVRVFDACMSLHKGTYAVSNGYRLRLVFRMVSESNIAPVSLVVFMIVSLVEGAEEFGLTSPRRAR